MSMLFAVFLSTAAQAAPPEGWTCEAAAFADDTCDCGCGAVDDDCSSSSADVCERDNCPEAEVAWQDNNASCMAAEGGCAAFPAPVAIALIAVVAVRRRRLVTRVV